MQPLTIATSEVETSEMCEEPGCESQGLTVYYAPDEVAGHYCAEHCFKHGFCCGCLYFWAGNERFDFGNGLCPECKSEAEAQEALEETEDDDGWYPGYEDLP